MSTRGDLGTGLAKSCCAGLLLTLRFALFSTILDKSPADSDVVISAHDALLPDERREIRERLRASGAVLPLAIFALADTAPSVQAEGLQVVLDYVQANEPTELLGAFLLFSQL